MKMKQEEFLKKLLEKNEYYKNGEFEVVGEYVDRRTRIITKDKYGLISITPDSLLKSQKGGIVQATNKEEYYYNILKEINPNIAEQVKVLEYRGDKEGVLIET